MEPIDSFCAGRSIGGHRNLLPARSRIRGRTGRTSLHARHVEKVVAGISLFLYKFYYYDSSYEIYGEAAKHHLLSIYSPNLNSLAIPGRML